MARVIGGIGTSHVPTIGLAFDRKKQDDPDWTPLFKGYEPVARWLADKKPDVLVFFYNDHATTFFFDHYPTFALGVSAQFPTADEGMGERPVPPIKGHPGLARHMAHSLVNDEFDISVFQELPIDHGCNSPLTMLWPDAVAAGQWPGAELPIDHGCNSPLTMLWPDAVAAGQWPGALVPIEVNVLQHPVPTPLRCYKLGQAVRRAVESYPEDLK
ncbi:MAG: hypothetical protein A3D95_07170, partial [Betaproteobacteria bacterium RIFCSPHIGHO2_12_FULL_69_13]